MNSLVRQKFIEEQAKLEKRYGNGNFLNSNELTNDADLGFLANALEYIDTKLHRPMYKFFWFKVLPYIYAGGAMEYASFYKTNYSISQDSAVASGSNNVIITAKAQYQKETTRIFPFSYVLEVGYIDGMKSDKIGFNIFDEYDRAINLQHNKMMEQVTFFGLPNVSDSYGLINIPETIVTVTEADKKFEDMTATEFFNLITQPALDIIADTEYAEELIPDRILVPLNLFQKLARPMSVAGESGATFTTGVSLYNYILQNLPSNYAGYTGEVSILPIRYLASAGKNGTGRIVVYRYSEDIMRGVIGMELTRGATLPDNSKQATLTSYVAFVGEPQLIRPSAIRYIDNK